MKNRDKINVAIAGVGNCAGSLIEGLAYYTTQETNHGLLFPILGGYSVNDINFVCAFDISEHKVDQKIGEAIYKYPNNFHRIKSVTLPSTGRVFRGPTLDGNPQHLHEFVTESKEQPVDVAQVLQEHQVDVLINLLPTGSVEATEYYGLAALEARCAFVNCIPTIFAQQSEIAEKFEKQKLPLLGDDIKSQVGSTILHRSVLNMLKNRGAKILSSSQINIGGNTDFANFVHRARTKLISKYKSLNLFVNQDIPNHIGHHYDPSRGAFKKALFDVEAEVFAGSRVKISIQLESDDKPNSAGSIIDLTRIAMHEKDCGRGGVVNDACAYYMKSAPTQIADEDAFLRVLDKWTSNEQQ